MLLFNSKGVNGLMIITWKKYRYILMWTPFCRTELCRPTWLNSNQHFLPRTPSLPYTPPPFKIFNCSFIGYDFSVSIIMSFLFGILFSFAIISFSYRVNNCVSCNSPFSLPLWGVSVHIYLISLSLSLSLSLTHTHTHRVPRLDTLPFIRLSNGS